MSLANLLRRWADRAEGVNSFVVLSKGPSNMNGDDVHEALAHGLTGANKYLNDLWRERTYVTVSTDPQPIESLL